MNVFLLALTSIAISSLAQIALKHGMTSTPVQNALTHGGLTAALAIATNLYVVSGLLMYGFGAAIWLGVLAKVDVSMAYPFVAIGFILTMLLAIFGLGEQASTGRIVGTLLIALGAVFVARS